MIKIHQQFALIIIFQMSFIFLGWSQDTKKYSHNSLAEKIYLQLDNEVYTTNKTIWFKAVILNAASHNANYSSGVLYVDLINSKSEIVISKLIKIKDGIGSGHFDLDRSIEEGVYLIRAYTEWNKNFDSDFVFKKYIEIHSETSEEIFKKVIQNIRVLDSTPDSYTLLADIYPKVMDRNHENELSITVTDGKFRETVYIDADKEEKYVLEYEVLKTSKHLELEVETSNAAKHKTTLSPGKDYLDLQFFPEGGKLISGLSSIIGFKALGVDGKGVEVEGVIVNKDNQTITSFNSNSLGMGNFRIENLKHTETYKAKVNYGSNKFETEIILPKVHTVGHAMSVKERDNIIFVEISSPNDKAGKINLKGLSRGYTYFEKEASLIDGKYIYVIPKKLFPDGVVAFTVFDENKQPMASRLYFNTRNDGRILINANLDKVSYEQRDEIKLNIYTKNIDSIPVIANASILGVTSKGTTSKLLNNQNILSYFLLSSDLKGTIEQPSYYFEPEKQKELDYLMLTQGWVNYKYTKPLDKRNYKLEKNLSISGVINKNSKAKKEELNLMLMTMDESRNTYTKTVKVPSSFNFDLEDMYGNEQDIIIQGAEDWDKEHKKYAIAIRSKTALPIHFDYDATRVIADSLITSIVNKNRAQKKQEDVAYFNTYGRTALDEVLISGYNMTPKRKEVFEKYGKPEVVIDGKDIIEKAEKFHSSGLYSTLLDFFPDKIKIDQDDTGLLSARVIGLPTLVLVDGIPVQKVFYPQLQQIMTSQITSFEVLETAKNFGKLYAILHPGAFPVPSYGGIISIYTKRGIGLFGALDFPDKSLNVEKIPVFALEKEFYSPKHDSNSYYDPNTPDLRGPIYWNPKVMTNENGEANINFYHSDDVGDFQIIIETVAENGKIGYAVVNYSVEKRKY